jgi:Spy/CpxP family protein refolding chaperone
MSVSMWRRPPYRLAALLLILATSQVGMAAQGAPPIPWWRSEQFQKDLGMTADQVSRVDAIFQATLPELRKAKEELDKLEAKLSTLIEADTDETTVARWVDKTEAARASLNKVRTLMLMHMRQVLSPDQRVRFKVLHERWVRERQIWDSRNPPPTPGSR